MKGYLTAWLVSMTIATRKIVARFKTQGRRMFARFRRSAQAKTDLQARTSANQHKPIPAATVARTVEPEATEGRPPEVQDKKDDTGKTGSSLLKKVLAAPTVALVVAVALAFVQWVQSPIAIESFTALPGSPAGLSADTIADQLKGHITEINRVSANLYETRKLGTASVPLDIKINNTEWTLANIARAFNIDLASAEVSGHMFQQGDWIVLQATTLRHGEVTVDTFHLRAPAAVTAAAQGAGTSASSKPDSYIDELDKKVACLALRVTERVSPDVAANYLFTTDVLNDPEYDNMVLSSAGHHPGSCLQHDDIELYSDVANDPEAHASERIKALVGLSIHYSKEHETYEEINMALAATSMAQRAHCEVNQSGIDSMRCWMHWFAHRSRNIQAEIAAWMQLGAARSDYAATQASVLQTRARHEAIDAYRNAIRLQPDYGLAYDAIGVQVDALHDTLGAFSWFTLSLLNDETPAAHQDLGWLYINRRNAFYGRVSGSPDWLAAAQVEFEKAIRMKPDYWSAHQGLGYALLERGFMTEAIDVLKPAVIHDPGDVDTRRHLASAFAGACRFIEAKQFFKTAYAQYEKARDDNNQLNTLTDWGKALDEFGAHQAAIEQEEAVLKRNPDHIYARQFLGQIEVASSDPTTVSKGISSLKTAVDSDAEKQDFVLLSYLVGLTETKHSDEAIAVYRDWSSKGWVPLPANAGNSAVTAVIPVRNQLVRLGYAKALVVSHQWAAAVAEFDRLSSSQIEYSVDDIGDLATQAKAASADPKTLQLVERLTSSALPHEVGRLCHDSQVSATTHLQEVSLTQ